ncbi:hypothetical protein VHUM_02506 [Vanrija humicola]|uniref:Peptide hydrolase n=1 Tax=Vanrija humicola TaxID=5417 RepID=A0A7D8V0E5_VANHU|nr:hypothetical protein VHUM_02506 [Vanrija humicola]
MPPKTSGGGHAKGNDQGHKVHHHKEHKEKTPWLWLLPVVTILPWILTQLHYQLPAPQPPVDDAGLVQPSEEIVLKHIAGLENCGYRTVGTHEAVCGEQYVIGEARKIADRCAANGVLDCELDVQKGNGYHMFSIMDHDVLKVYAGITNVVLKIKAKNPPSGKSEGPDAVLLGAHIDSTLPSPGASDDGMGVGVMLDLARVLVDRNQPFDNSIIFMWNGGEETLQDGSHLYSTQHYTGKDVRAMINLESAGSMGGALLFQATSREMLEAFSHAPLPRGTVIAADVFSSGIIMSDTDFGQFEQYLNVSGLDMAVTGHSYFYHTRKDTLANIETGSAQHFTTNMIAIIDYLLGPGSPLHSSEPFHPPDVVYMSLYDRVFVQWSMATADVAYVALAAIGGTVCIANLRGDRLKVFGLGLLGGPLSMIVGVVTAVALAFLMIFIDAKLRWFSHEGLCVILYLPAAVFGQLGFQYLLSGLLSTAERAYMETASYFAQVATLLAYMLLLQAARIRSAYAFGIVAGILLIGAVGSQISFLLGRKSTSLPFFIAYVVPMSLLVVLGLEAYSTTLDIFVPLAGRMGRDAPSEIIISIISSAVGLALFPLNAPLFARLSRRGQKGLLLRLFLGVVMVTILYAGPWWSPYDSRHPKRVGIQYLYNHTSGDHVAHVAFMDAANPTHIINDFHERYGNGAELEHTVLTDYDSDWDTLYPVSTFLDTYRWKLPHVEFDWPKLGAETSRVQHDNGTATIHLKMNHTDLVWPAFAFEADLADWSFDFDPPHGLKRHHIKAATSVDVHFTELELVVNLKPEEKLNVHWSAIDLNQMVPGTAYARGPDMPASKWLLDMDHWARDKYDDSLELLMSGVVVGNIEV